MGRLDRNRIVKAKQSGFTLIELAVATAVLLFGVAAVIQLVPYAMSTNQANRYDTTSVVIAQRYLDEMMAQPLTATTMTDPICGTMSLGAGTAGTSVLSPSATYLTMFNGFATVDFTQTAVAGYNCNYIDPNSASASSYQVRWGVVVKENTGGQVVSKRYVVGVSRPASQFRFPVDVDAVVEK
jgi:prepilin-type N-terminal cleavage/methylation domain-containing protein